VKFGLRATCRLQSDQCPAPCWPPCTQHTADIEHNKNILGVGLRVVGDNDEIAEEARRLASERTLTARRFLSVLDRGLYTDLDPAKVPAAERDFLLPALRTMVGQRTGVVRIDAARALVEFGDRVGSEVLIECLQSEDPKLLRDTLNCLTGLGLRDRVRLPNSPIDADALLIALEPSLEDASPWVRERALTFIGYLGTPLAFDRLAALLGDARPDVRAHAAWLLGDAGYDRGALAVIDELLRVLPRHSQRYSLIGALEHLCKSADVDIRTRAATVVVGFIRSNLADRKYSALEADLLANDVWQCMDGIAAACSPEDREALHEILRQLLREVLASKDEWWVRGRALRRLAQLEGQAGIARLIDAFSDPDLRKDALKGLASLAAGSDDPAVLEALDSEIRRCDATHISGVVKAFVAIGGNAKSLSRDILDRLEPGIAMTVRWLLNDIGPREAAAKLLPACGNVAAADEEMLKDLDSKWRTEPDATLVVWHLLGGWNRIACVFYKTVGKPVDHDATVRELAAITGEVLIVDEVVQTTEPSGDFRVLLVHQGAGYSFPVQDHGRWCNVRAVIDGLNGIIDRLGLSEQFIELNSGTSDVALVTFARADLFMLLARELGILLGRAD
jgi:HEAT repeat protein